jgi:two-component system chemotaxis response regulator CheY
VLVVDDSRVIRAVVRGCLRSTGYAVDEAGDGRAALDMCQARGYDVVVSDVGMPGLDGLGLLQALCQRADRPEVVLLTASSDLARESAARGVNLAAHECLSKPPAAPDTVVLAVERALQRKRVRDGQMAC